MWIVQQGLDHVKLVFKGKQDVHQFLEAIDENDLETAVAIYQGDMLPDSPVTAYIWGMARAGAGESALAGLGSDI